MMDREEVSSIIKLPEVSSPDLIKINPGLVGYYKVNYDLKEFSKLYDAVSYKALDLVDRLNILDDLFSLIESGRAKSVDGLRLF